MATNESAGIAAWRRRGDAVEVFLVHPGGPYWHTKDRGAWGIPKGGIDEGEDREQAALREFAEEVGVHVDGPLVKLPSCRLRSGKLVHAFAARWPDDQPLVDVVASNTFTMEWPPRSGRQETFPEIDRGAWFALDEAREKINDGLLPLLAALAALAAGA